MAGIADIELGHEAYRAQNWKEAHDRLSAAEREVGLDAAGLETLANAAYLRARDREAAELWTRAHNVLVDRGEVAHAARIGFLLSLTSLLRGEASISGGWLARAQRLLETAPGRHVEEGFCWIVVGLRALHGDDCGSALRRFEDAVALATEFHDPDLLTLSLLGRGQALIASGRAGEGVACLDEAMVSVTSNNIAPIFSGIVYCAVILTCQRIFDAERARQWTRAFNAWCRPQSDLVPFRGQCLIHRSEILQMRGDWRGAMREAERACDWLAGKSEPTVGRAHYQKGELHRLFGELEPADRCYREAVCHGIDPEPGHALLRLRSGQIEAAFAAIRTACGTCRGVSVPGGDPGRFRLLSPAVEIFLAAGQNDLAIAAADELAAGARRLRMPLLEAMSHAATGAVLAVTDRLDAALSSLKSSLATWRNLGMPYEMARTRVLIADVCHRLGDRESAVMHGAAAGAAFRELGAIPDLAALGRRGWHARDKAGAGLTRRQMEVLRLLADGRSNRAIAGALGISEHTVARHVSNIFDKAGVSSRAAAVGFAHRNGLLGQAGHGES